MLFVRLRRTATHRQHASDVLTLSNVNNQRGETVPPSIGLAPDVFPEAVSSKTGVSVKYASLPMGQWYVFRASYGRVDMASDYLVENGTYTYVARKYVERYVKGKRKRFLIPLIPNLLFVYTTEAQAKTFVNETPALSYLSFYYNHFVTDEEQRNPPLVIADAEMQRFVLATSNRNKHLLFVDSSRCHYKTGEQVVVIDGPFRGVDGKVARIAGQQRVVVSLPSIGLISTAYIPTAFIRKADDV